MTFIEKIMLFERLDQLIRMKNTGSPKDLAKRLDVSVRNVYYLISLMREMGADISFSSDRNSFIYVEEGYFIIGFRNKNPNKQIGGGIGKHTVVNRKGGGMNFTREYALIGKMVDSAENLH